MKKTEINIIGPKLPKEKKSILPNWLRDLGFGFEDLQDGEFEPWSANGFIESSPYIPIATIPKIEEENTVPEGIELDDVWKKTGYDHLYFMCKRIKNNGSSFSSSSTSRLMDNRVVYIVDQLNKLNVNYKIIPFNSFSYISKPFDISGEKSVNIQAYFKSTVETNETIVFTAHHDIVNDKSDNCQDNTASVCNLLDLCKEISLMDVREKNVYIVFTDGEECGGKGAKQLAKQINEGELGDVKFAVSLELTANGSEIWAEIIYTGHIITDNLSTIIGHKVKQFRTPYNESMSLRSLNVDACCIGILPPAEIESLEKGKWSQSWGLCHSLGDTFELSAKRDNMSNFVNVLKQFINLK